MTHPPAPQSVQDIVDALIDRTTAAHPGVDFSILVSEEASLLIPKDSDTLLREDGFHKGHVYRDRMIEPIGGGDGVIDAVPLDGAAPTYYGVLGTGEVTTTSPYPVGDDAA